MKPPSKRKAQTGIFAAAPKRRKQLARKRKTPTLSERKDEFDTQSDIRIEADNHVRNEDVHSQRR